MATRKISLNELRNLVKQIVEEEISNNTRPNIDLLKQLPKASPEDMESMADFFDKSKEDMENEDDKILVNFEDFKKLPYKMKRSFLYWLGWDAYGYSEIRDTWGEGNFDGEGNFHNAIENLNKQGFFVDYQIEGDKNTYRIKMS